MATKCPVCGGTEAEDNRFYCSRCGSAIRGTSLPEDMVRKEVKHVNVMDVRALVLGVFGFLIGVLGLFVYIASASWDLPSGIDAWMGWAGLMWISSFCMVALAVLMNWGQDLPRRVSIAVALELVFGIVGLVVSLVQSLMVTSTEWVTSAEGTPLYEISIYGHREVMSVMIFVLGWVPLFLVWLLWTRRRYAWHAALISSMVNVPIIAFLVADHVGMTLGALMIAVQVAVVLLLALPSVRLFYLDPSSPGRSISV